MESPPRNSRMKLNEVYFWTNTIKDWVPILSNDKLKEIIISSWRTLVERNKIRIYGFVIMPNHLHVVWEMIAMNGNEMPHASFNKFTSHQFLKSYQSNEDNLLDHFKIKDDLARNHRFWQRDPLAILTDSKFMMEQKLEYIHLNPLQEHWNLADRPENYHWSSAKFYETGINDFDFIEDYRDRF